jgi:hypothetical protein
MCFTQKPVIKYDLAAVKVPISSIPGLADFLSVRL